MEDLTGQRFGRLVVLGRGEDYVDKNGYHRPRWICQCDCGGITLCQSSTLTGGKAKSCGCLQKELASVRAKNSPNRKPFNLAGQRFGKLTAIEIVETKDGLGAIWRCKCDCGNEALVPAKALRSGNTKSCGCLRDEKISNLNKSHGESHTRLYNVWVGMHQRCNDPNHKSYQYYGGRGIRVCKEWDTYQSFKKWAIENGYNPNAQYGDCTIDRINVDGDYCPENCRWVDEAMQALNRRNSKNRSH